MAGEMKDLKARTLRGGIARSCSVGARFGLRLVTLMILARLLGPKDFGLVGMVTAFTGVLEIFRDFGLSAATVQRVSVTEAQISILFWINVAFGAILALIMAAMAPVIGAFYHEPRLPLVTVVLAFGLLLNAAGVQHSALLQREMRFTTLAAIEVISLVVSGLIGILGAKVGYGYWALVAMTVALPLTTTIGVWCATRWIPGPPRRKTGIRSMVRFGGTVTVTGLAFYLANNLDKVLLGRFWGVDALGLYGRAYQLINIPTTNLNSAAGEVAFSALSRLQDDPVRRRSYFLKGFSLVLGMTMPITIACALFANDVIVALLGPKWREAAPIFRLMVPTIFVLSIANPLAWLLLASGRIKRQFQMCMVLAPAMTLGCIIGLPFGPKGVAAGYSIVMTLWLFPVIAWTVHGTEISFWDVVKAIAPPFISSAAAGVLALVVGRVFVSTSSPLTRLMVESAVLVAAFFGSILLVEGQRSLYLGLLSSIFGSSREKRMPASA